ncbi:MAG: hypothetical protein U0401_12515 [Anaerolineae bacterium]
MRSIAGQICDVRSHLMFERRLTDMVAVISAFGKGTRFTFQPVLVAAKTLANYA